MKLYKPRHKDYTAYDDFDRILYKGNNKRAALELMQSYVSDQLRKDPDNLYYKNQNTSLKKQRIDLENMIQRHKPLLWSPPEKKEEKDSSSAKKSDK